MPVKQANVTLYRQQGLSYQDRQGRLELPDFHLSQLYWTSAALERIPACYKGQSG